MAQSYAPVVRGMSAAAAAVFLLFAFAGREISTMLSPDRMLVPQSLALIDALRVVSGVAAAGTGVLALFDTRGSVLRSRAFVCALPFLALLVFAFVKYSAGVENTLYLALVKEDSLVEDAGALAVFAAGLMTLRNAYQAWRRSDDLLLFAGLLLLGLFMLWLALEEVSYAQRLLGYGTPASLDAVNYQREANFHNIAGLEWLMDVIGPDIIIAWGLFGWLVAALLKRVAADADWTVKLHLLVPPWFVASWFIPYAIWAHLDVCCDQQVITISRDQEPAEAFLEFAFLAYACWLLRYLPELPLFARDVRS